ncbi:hypothetical protein [Actinophytocola xinjiangensis]|nr:hypothetical protein [Actinophytocola xinjiangensis]
MTSVMCIGAGSAHAVRADGTARSWGQNSTGQLGNSTIQVMVSGT